MDVKKEILISLAVLVVLVVVFYIIASTITRLTGFTITGKAIYSDVELEDFVRCLNNEGIKLYFSPTSSECKSQKKLFKDAFPYLDIIDCSLEDCSDLEEVPAWEIDGKVIYGKQEIKNLEELTGCKIR